MKDQIKGWVQFIGVIAFVIGSFMVSGALQTSRKPSEAKTTPERILFVETKSTTHEAYGITFTTTGLVQARAAIDVVPEISGRVTEINDQFFEGGTFEADEVLFKIEPIDFELEIERLQAEVARAKTALDLERAESKASIAEWKLVNGSKAPPALVARKPQMAEARASLKSAEAQLKNAELDLKRTAFSLPYKGRVLSANLEIGQYVTVGQSFGSVFNLSTLEVRASLEDQQLEWLYGTRDPKITLSTTYQGKEKSYDGVLKRGLSALDPQTRFAAVSFGFAQEGTTESSHSDFLPGIFMTITIQGPRVSGVSVLPASALQKDGRVWRVAEENTIEPITPDIVFSDDNHIALRGLPQSVQIVTSKLSGATNGMKIKTADNEE